MTNDVVEKAPDAGASVDAKPADESKISVESSSHYSHESERLLIGVMLNTSRAEIHQKILAAVSFEDFFVEQHQVAWRLIEQMRENGIESDPTSLIDHAKQQRSFVGGPLYIMEAVQDPVIRMASEDAVMSAANRIKEYSLIRRLMRSISLTSSLISSGQAFDQAASFLEDEITNIRSLAKTSRAGVRHASHFYDAMVAKLMAKMDGEVVDPGISTGFSSLDRVLGGDLPKESLIVLAGRPGMGKTAFASAVEEQISNRGTPTLFFSLEMTGMAIAQRKVARHSRIKFNAIKTCNLADRDFSAFTESIHVLGQAPCYIDDTPGLTMSEIRARARAFIMEHAGGAIFIDYMQIVQPPPGKAKDPMRHVSDTSQALVAMARELKCPVVALAQLNRSVESRPNKRPLMSDLRESGQIEQDASVIMFLYRDEYYTKDACQEPGVTEVIVAKNRDGECQTVKFSSQLETMSYSEIGAFNSEEE